MALCLLFALCSISGAELWGQLANVSLHVRMEGSQPGSTKVPGSHDKSSPVGSAGVVAWLSSESAEAAGEQPLRQPQTYRMVQKDKQFTPHVLVVPTGTSVEFPNLDPFFHNVFSLFNGKRFDLGLYEAGSRRSVRFDREGVSYIFCNIHPQMGAVIVSLKTPYYAVSSTDGTVTIHGVPSGNYRLHLWAEDVPAASLEKAEHDVRVSNDDLRLGEIVLPTRKSTMAHHKNKFGDDYKNDPANPY